MKITLYIYTALSAAIGALGVIYLFAGKVRFDSREVGKLWQQHPITGQGC